MEKTKRNWLLTGLLAILMMFGLCLGFGLNSQVQTAYATGGEPNELATADQVMFISQTIDEFNSLPTGVSFENGVLTIGTDYNRSEGSDSSHPANIIVNTSNDEKADLTVVINKNAFYCRIANPSGNLTIVANGTVDALEVVAGENLTIKGSGMFLNISANYFMFNHNPDKYSAIYAGEKLTIEGSVNCRLYDSSYTNTKSALCAKSLEINTKGTVKLDATSSPESSDYRAPISFHSCSSVNDLAGKLVVKQGQLTLRKYYNSEATENNSKFGFVGYCTNNTGNLSSYSFDTEYKTFTDYPYAINDGDGAYQNLVVKNRTVTFKKNGGTGDTMDSLTYLPVGKEVTLPECTYTAPEGQHFAGWALGSTDGTIKQPSETFVLEEGADPDDWATYDYYPLYATWEDDEVATTYTVTYKPNNEAVGVVRNNIPAGAYNLEDNHFAAPSGKQFKAWNVNGVEKHPGDTITISENTIIIAIWEDIEVETTYTVTYKPNNETAGVVRSNISAGAYNLEDNHFAAPSGKQFKAWNVNGVEKHPGDTITISENTIIIAVWEDVETPVDPETPEQPENPETPSANENKGLSAGAIVAIVLAVVVVGGVGGFALVWFVIKKKTFADLVKVFKKK